MTSSKYTVLNNKSFFEIKGSDRKSFLQGLITNDIYKCTKNKSIYSVFLTPQGKFLADFFIINMNETFLFEINKEFMNELLNKLNFYKLRSNIDINIVKNLKSLAVTHNNNLFKNLKTTGEAKLIQDGVAFIDPRNINMGIKIEKFGTSFSA